MIYIQTQAYNASKTLRRTVESVLKQTHSDFSYYLCDNGSTDNGETRRIIEKYAENDARIVPFYNKGNFVWTGNEKYIKLTCNIGKGDYYCMLDADDEYLPDFFERALAFAKENDLDIVSCGSGIIDSDTGKTFDKRTLPKKNNLILDNGKVIDKHFMSFYRFLSGMWGKLYSSSVLNFSDSDFRSFREAGINSTDSVVSVIIHKKAKRFGILSGVSHLYYKYSNSASRIIYPNRFKGSVILYETMRDFLIAKYGSVSTRNEKILLNDYFYSILDTMDILLNAKISLNEKIAVIKEIFTHEYTKRVLVEPYCLLIVPDIFVKLKKQFLLLADQLLEQPNGTLCPPDAYIDLLLVYKLVFENDTKLKAYRDGLLNHRSWRDSKLLREISSFIRKNELLYFPVKAVLSLKR